MPARFNPPPGWQVPAGFRPEPGWAPDPSWPPAPAGWTYWITEEPSVVATVSAPASVRPATSDATEVHAAVGAPTAGHATAVAPPPVPAAGTPGGVLAADAASSTQVFSLAAPSSTAPARPAAAPGPPPSAASAPTAAPGPGAGAPSRTRSVARQGAAIPLPAGPLGPPPGPEWKSSGTPGQATRASTRSQAPDDSGDGRRLTVNPWLVPSVAIACFAFGVIIGIVASLAQASDAGQATKDAQRAQAQVVEDREQLNAQRAEIAADQEAILQREKDVQARETAVSQKEAEQVARETALAEQQAQAEQAQEEARSNQGWWQGGNSGDSAGFQTCEQLRASGYQTPIKEHDPGYHRLLDRDGNGVACE